MVRQYLEAIRTADFNSIRAVADIPNSFLMKRDSNLSTYYIPFDYVNSKAKLVLVGITPGLTQWKNENAEMQRQLVRNNSLNDALEAVKNTGAFSGAMRSNLIALLNTIGIHQWLGIPSAELLFSSHAHFVQTTSILRHPIFVDDINYNGKPSMLKSSLLRDQIDCYFSEELKVLSKAIYIPLGPTVSQGLDFMVRQGRLNSSQILHGLPHPSGANAERIAYFCGRKERAALSSKTNADKLDAIRNSLIAQVRTLS